MESLIESILNRSSIKIKIDDYTDQKHCESIVSKYLQDIMDIKNKDYEFFKRYFEKFRKELKKSNCLQLKSPNLSDQEAYGILIFIPDKTGRLPGCFLFGYIDSDIDFINLKCVYRVINKDCWYFMDSTSWADLSNIDTDEDIFYFSKDFILKLFKKYNN